MDAMATDLGGALKRHLNQLKALSGEELLAERYNKYRNMGVFLE
jgi:acetyl-CoA carboxylase alpha subunit